MKTKVDVICVKKLEAIALIYSGSSKTQVRNELKVKAKKLNKWLEEEKTESLHYSPYEYLEKKALHMYFYKISRKKICKVLFLDKYQLNNIIKKSFKIDSTEKVNYRAYLGMSLPQQDGRTKFITQICRKNKYYNKVLRLHREGYSVLSITKILKISSKMVDICLMESKK